VKKLLLAALAIGIAIPLFAHIKQFYYVSVLALALFLIVTFKKGPFTIVDALLLLVVTIPVHTFRFGTEETFIRLSEIAFVPLFFWWAIQRFLKNSNEPIKFRQEFILLVAYLCINIVSMKNSMLPLISIKRIAILAYLFLFTYMIGDIINIKSKVDTLIKAMVLVSGLSGVIAALQCVFPRLLFFTPVPIGTFLGLTFYRAGCGWHDPNYYALYLAMNASITLAYLLSIQGKSRLFKACFTLQLIGLLATFSRTAFISFVIVAVYLLFKSGRRNLALVSSFLIIVTAATLAHSTLAIYQKAPFVASAVYRVADKQKIMERPSLVMGHRWGAFQANWSMFVDHPLLGVGPFMAMYNFEKYKPSGYSYPISWLASHNQYIQLLAEKGIFGFLIFMGFVALMLANINGYIRNITQPDYRAYLMGFKAAVLVYLIASFALETSYELQFWLTMGLSMALFQIINRETRHAS
jgi:O-antigen ligase